MTTINMNDTVWIKLNDKGRAMHRNSHERAFERFGDRYPYNQPVENAAGYIHMKLHEVMHEFGSACILGFEPPFETQIHLTEPLA